MRVNRSVLTPLIVLLFLGLATGAARGADTINSMVDSGSSSGDSRSIVAGYGHSVADPSSAARLNPWRFSMVMDTTAEGTWVRGYGSPDRGRYGFEQYGNLRLEAPLQNQGKVFAAINVQAASGTLVPVLSTQGVTAVSMGEGYASSVELERLYYRVEGESYEGEAGLLRIPFGFGQAWRPTDFLNPPNPLNPGARPPGVLAAVWTIYPSDFTLLRFFVSSGPDPSQVHGEGVLGGVSGEVHNPTYSMQGWYALQAPYQGKERPDHRVGLSFKWDGVVAFVLDALYTLEGDAVATGWWYDRRWNPLRGLQAAAGLDGSWGEFIYLVQYLYNGQGALDPGDSLGELYDSSPGDWRVLPPERRVVRTGTPLQELNRKHYLFGSLLYKMDDYTRLTLSSTVNLDDGSWVPAVSIEREPFQGFTLQVTARLFLDPHELGIGPAGEWGPLHTGKRGDFVVKVQVRL